MGTKVLSKTVTGTTPLDQVMLKVTILYKDGVYNLLVQLCQHVIDTIFNADGAVWGRPTFRAVCDQVCSLHKGEALCCCSTVSCRELPDFLGGTLASRRRV